MQIEFVKIPGKNLAELLAFVHGDQNQVTSPEEGNRSMIVRIVAVRPQNEGGGTTQYGLTLNILEWLPKGKMPGQDRVDPKYLLEVYEILGQNRRTECVSE